MPNNSVSVSFTCVNCLRLFLRQQDIASAWLLAYVECTHSLRLRASSIRMSFFQGSRCVCMREREVGVVLQCWQIFQAHRFMDFFSWVNDPVAMTAVVIIICHFSRLVSSSLFPHWWNFFHSFQIPHSRNCFFFSLLCGIVCHKGWHFRGLEFSPPSTSPPPSSHTAVASDLIPTWDHPSGC